MRAKIIATGPAGLAAAAKLKFSGWTVEVVKISSAARLRPSRLRASDVVALREIVALAGQDPSLLTFAPEFESWGLPDGPRYRFALRGLEWQSDKWVLEDRLQDLLLASLKALGVSVRISTDLVPPPYVASGVPEPKAENPLWLVEADPGQLSLWPVLFRSEAQLRVEGCEVRLPFGRLTQVDACQVQRLDGCSAYLEPHPDSGFVLSLYASSKYPLERALAGLRNPRGRGPSAWRALFMVNPGAEITWRRHSVGPTEFYYPGVFGFGAALGEISPGVNLQLSESLGQVERLVRILSQSGADGAPGNPRSWLSSSESWAQSESSRLARMARRASRAERLCLEEGPRKVVLPLTSIMPRAVRHFLRLPV